MLRSLHGINGHVYHIDGSLHHLCRLQELSTNYLGCSVIHISRYWMCRIFHQACHVFGRRQILLTSFFFFTCFSLACGFSQTVEQLILFRTLQGIGGTGLYSLAMVICPEIAPPKYLHLVVGLLGFTIAVAGVMGPVLGGVITGTTTWRWIFWLK